jgi:DsbC/DsbD-like thiol-disulfide interchange protein
MRISGMKAKGRAFFAALVLSIVSLLSTGSAAQNLSDLPRADTVVKPRAYVSLEPVPRGRTFEIAVVAEIQRGFHINANKVLEDYLIPTSLQADWPKGFRLVKTTYPPGELQKFEFSEKLLNVYDGTVTLRMKVQAATEAPLGATTVPVRLRYQACNDRACLPPVRLSVPLELRIAEAGAKAKATNTEIFQAKPARKP